MITTVHVTGDDIAKGEPEKCASCPIALAVKRLLNPSYQVAITDEELNIHYHALSSHEYYFWTPLPDVAKRFVAAFDRHRSLPPFTFEIDLDERVLKAVPA
jgi:hypothetical protein